MRKVFLLALMLALAGLTATHSAWAYTQTIWDTTLVRSYQNNAPVTWKGADWHDVIGEVGGGTPFTDGFDVQKVEVTWNNADIQFKIFTNYPATGMVVGSYNTGIADLFIDRNADFNGGIPGRYDAVIKMSGSDVGTVYSDGVAWTVYFSQFSFGSTGYIYGGQYDQLNPRDSVVEFIPGTFNGSSTPVLGTGSVAWTGSGPYVVVIDLPGLNATHEWDKFRFVWNVAHCSNESISGTAVVPLPAPVWLLGSALLGLWARRRQN